MQRAPSTQLAIRAEMHAALGDPTRLAIVDELRVSDRSPGELADRFGLAPSLLTFHLHSLERAGLVRLTRSTADRRRKYVTIVGDSVEAVAGRSQARRGALREPIVFVCTQNSARSQLAAALWAARDGVATSAGTTPASEIHPGAIAAARRAGLRLSGGRPRRLGAGDRGRQVITVCDRAHEELPYDETAWHWSVPDPAASGTDVAFDRAVELIAARLDALTPRHPGAPT